MAGTRDAILDALEELTADELKKFKMKLLSVPLRDGYGRIPRGALLPMDAVDLTDKLVSCYLEAYAAELTAQVLRDMGMQDTAERLRARARAPGEEPSAPGAPRLTQPPAEHLPLGLFRFLFLLPPNKALPAGEGGFPRSVLTPRAWRHHGKGEEGPLMPSLSLQALEPRQQGSGPLLPRCQPYQVRPSHPNSPSWAPHQPHRPQPCTAYLPPEHAHWERARLGQPSHQPACSHTLGGASLGRCYTHRTVSGAPPR